MTLSIVIVHYNTPVELIKCLRSVTQYLGDINFEVIVVDNCSVDRTIENFKKEFPWVGFYFMKENLGYAKANNFAVNKSTGDFILLLNPDTELIEDCISPMLKFWKITLLQAPVVQCSYIRMAGFKIHVAEEWAYFMRLPKL